LFVLYVQLVADTGVLWFVVTMFSGQVDQLFSHLSQQLVQVRSSLSDVIQHKYDYYTSSVSADDVTVQLVDNIARQLTALRAVIDYTHKVSVHRSRSVSCHIHTYQHKICHFTTLFVVSLVPSMF